MFQTLNELNKIKDYFKLNHSKNKNTEVEISIIIHIK